MVAHYKLTNFHQLRPERFPSHLKELGFNNKSHSEAGSGLIDITKANGKLGNISGWEVYTNQSAPEQYRNKREIPQISIVKVHFMHNCYETMNNTDKSGCTFFIIITIIITL